MNLRVVIRNINPLNILLLTAVVILSLYFLTPVLDIKVKYASPAAKQNNADRQDIPEQVDIPSLQEYVNIAEENLFHPTRQIPVEKVEEQPLPKPEFVLYGTLITDDVSLAYLEDLKSPLSTPGRGKRQVSLRTGETLSGFTLRQVEAEKVVMVRGEEQMIVLLDDPSRRKAREMTGSETAAQPQAGAPARRQPESRQVPATFQPPQARTDKQPMSQESVEKAKNAFLEVFRGAARK
ncbi:MAG: hypothetical protein AB1390_00350 [Nitrospirota bacterium]